MGRRKIRSSRPCFPARTTDVQVLRVYPVLRAAFDASRICRCVRIRDCGEDLFHRFVSCQGEAWKTLAPAYRRVRRNRPCDDGRPPDFAGVGRKTGAACFGTVSAFLPWRWIRMSSASHGGWGGARGEDRRRSKRVGGSLVPRKWWGPVNRAFIPFGRDICRPGDAAVLALPDRAIVRIFQKTPFVGVGRSSRGTIAPCHFVPSALRPSIPDRSAFVAIRMRRGAAAHRRRRSMIGLGPWSACREARGGILPVPSAEGRRSRGRRRAMGWRVPSGFRRRSKVRWGRWAVRDEKDGCSCRRAQTGDLDAGREPGIFGVSTW